MRDKRRAVTLLAAALAIASGPLVAGPPELSLRLERSAGDVSRGKLVATVAGKETTLAERVWGAWIVEGRRAVAYAVGNGTGYEGEGQTLWRWDAATGEKRELLRSDLRVVKAASAASKTGREILLVSLADGGAGVPSVAIVAPERKAWATVYRQRAARFADVRDGVIAVALYKAADFEGDRGGSARPYRTVYLNIDGLLNLRGR